MKQVTTYVGIDAHKKDLFIAMLVGQQKTPVTWQLANEPQAVRRLVRDSIRAAVRDSGARRVHLFMSAPAGAALLLGHIWNRVGTTIVYEDLSPGYVSTFEFPG